MGRHIAQSWRGHSLGAAALQRAIEPDHTSRLYCRGQLHYLRLWSPGTSTGARHSTRDGVACSSSESHLSKPRALADTALLFTRQGKGLLLLLLRCVVVMAEMLMMTQ